MVVKTEAEIPAPKGHKIKPNIETPEGTALPPKRETITIPLYDYEVLIRDMERLRLIEAYVLNNEYYSVDTMRALVGYTGEE